MIMKKYILICSLFLITAFIPGCYTVVWDPDEDMPDAQAYEEEYYEDGGYYRDPYYGDYGYYYEYPWWLTVRQAASNSGGGKTIETSNSSDNSTMDRIRNRDGSRSSGTERIITNNPAASTGSSGSSSSSSANKTSTSSGSNTRREEAKSSDTKENTNTSTRSGSSSGDTNKTRNTDGGRNDGGRKR
jgi:hypothetical protein